MARSQGGVEARQQRRQNHRRAGDVVEGGVEQAVHAGADVGDVDALCAIVDAGVYEDEVREILQRRLQKTFYFTNDVPRLCAHILRSEVSF